MNITLFLAVLGILATISFGIWGVIITIRRRYPARIMFVREECISLFDDIVRNMPDLSVGFKGEAVEESIVLLKGSFINSGSKDITDLMVTEELAIYLPEGFRWVQVRVVDSSEKVNAKATVKDDKHLTFQLGHFRCNEFVKFESLAEVPSGPNDTSPRLRLLKNIQFTHRIADTGAIERKTLPPDKADRAFRSLMIPATAFILFTFILLGIFCWVGEPVNVNYRLPDGSGGQIEVRVRQNLFGKLIIKQIGGDFRQESTPEKFFSQKGLKSIPIKRRIWVFPLIIMVIIMIMLAFLVRYYVDYRTTNRIKKLLSNKNINLAKTGTFTSY